MREVKTKLGILYVEEMDDKREDGRIKIYDSEKRYFDYVSDEDLNYEDFISELQEVEHIQELLTALVVMYEFYTMDWEEVSRFLRVICIDKYETPESLLTNEWVNKIGDYYVVITEC